MPYGRGHKLSKEECQRRVMTQSPNIRVLEYESATVPVLCQCLLCGNEWREPSKNLYRGSNCPRCFKRKKNDWTTEDLTDRMATISPEVNILGDYVSMTTYIECLCGKCGHNWRSTPDNLLSGRGCPRCSQRRAHDKRRKSHGHFIEQVHSMHPNIHILGTYRGAKTPVMCECLQCGDKWSPQPTNLLNGCGCPRCGVEQIRIKQIKPHSQFVAEVWAKNPDIEVVSVYRGSRRPVSLRCKVCGTTWKCLATNAATHGTGCPGCSASRGEQAIAAHLKSMGVTYIPQHRFDGLVGVGGSKLSYDFFLPSHNILIEYQGEYHDGSVVWQTDEQFAKQQEHDRRKRQYAHDNQYGLIEIWYWQFNQIQSILTDLLGYNSPLTA